MRLERHLALAQRHPLDFTVQYPPRREYFMDRFRDVDAGARGKDVLVQQREWLLYVHVPFCEARCSYCNFAVDTRRGTELQARYVRALRRELEAVEALPGGGAVVRGVDIGGGTPTLLETALLVELLEPLGRYRNLSIETTPAVAAAEPEKLNVLAGLGVERISVGIQATGEALLRRVGRGAQVAQEARALGNLLAAGFRRVNVDLVFGLPGQTLEEWKAAVAQAAGSGVDSVTTYDCLYRGKGRAFTHRAGALPAAEQYGALYDAGYELLTARGFHAPYGSVNFSRHEGETGTSTYFEGRLLDGLPYLGVGNGASSLCGEAWWFAPSMLDAWLARVEGGEVLPVGDAYALPLSERMAKQALLSLSFGRLDPVRFQRAHGVPLEQAYGPALARAEEEGWLWKDEGGEYRLVPGSFGALPRLRALFYAPKAIAWLEQQAGTLWPGLHP